MKLTAVSFSLSNTPKTIEAWENRLLNEIQMHLKNDSQIMLYPELFLMELITYFQGSLKEQMQATSHYLLTNFSHKVSSILKGTNTLLCLGSAPRVVGNDIFNSAFVWLKGDLHFQDKMHLTPWEVDFKVGTELKIFNFNGLKISTPICFDIEHPGLALKLKQEQIDILLVPYATFNMNGSRRVNRCASSRSVELGAIILTTPLVGDFDCDLIDHHEGHQGFFLPAQECVTISQETLSAYSVGEHLINQFECPDDLMVQLKTKNEETKPYLKIDNSNLAIIQVS